MSTFYDKPVKRLDALYSDLAIDEDGSRIDVLISTTCSQHLSSAGKRLVDAYEGRKNKFKLFCVIHHASNMDRMENDLRPWALEGALSFITLSAQYDFISSSSHATLLTLFFSSTARRTELNLGWLMARPNGITGVPYDDCPIFTFVPIFPYDIALHSNSTSLQHESSSIRVKQAVMQGGLEHGRRDYAHIFQGLEAEIRGIYHLNLTLFPSLGSLRNLADPKLWGYVIPNNNSAPFTPDPEVIDPFTLVSSH